MPEVRDASALRVELHAQPAGAENVSVRTRVWPPVRSTSSSNGSTASAWLTSRPSPPRLPIDPHGPPSGCRRAGRRAYVPARYLRQVNPAYLELVMWLASHVHDEARHVEMFTKRAVAGGYRSSRPAGRCSPSVSGESLF